MIDENAAIFMTKFLVFIVLVGIIIGYIYVCVFVSIYFMLGAAVAGIFCVLRSLWIIVADIVDKNLETN